MSEWKEGIWLGISAFLTAMLITFAVVLGDVAKEVGHMQQNEINSTEEMKEYRKWAQYDNTILNPADVISCIMSNKAKAPSILVDNVLSFDDPDKRFNYQVDTIAGYTWDTDNPLKNIYYIWDGTKRDTNVYPDYTFDALNMYIQPENLYRARVVKDLNGAVKYIWFKRIFTWSNYENITISGDDLINCLEESFGFKMEFRLIDYSDPANPIYDDWNEEGISIEQLNYYISEIPADGSYNAVIYRDWNGQLNYIEFRRV